MFKLQNLLLVISSFLLIITLGLGGVGKDWVHAETSQEVLHQQAKSLTQAGQEHLNRGDTITALKDWQEATKIYRQINYQEGVAGSLINQSTALQQLGFNLKACSILLESLKLDTDWLCNSLFTQAPSKPREALSVTINRLPPSRIDALGLQKLGDILWLIGKTDESELVLLKALDASKTIKSTPNIESVKLSLGNVQRAVFNQLRDRYPDIGDVALQESYLFSIQQKITSSAQYYEQLEQPGTSRTIQVTARLNHLALLIDANNWLASQIKLGKAQLADFHKQIQTQIHPLSLKIQQNRSDLVLLPDSESVLAQLNYATSLNHLADKSLAIQYTEAALQLAQNLNSPRLQSNCFGILAELVQEQDKSQKYLQAALNLAESVQARDLAWQWQHQLGRLYQKQGDYDNAVQAYNRAIENLRLVRNNLLSVTPDVQYSFRDQVVPVYREYMHLLLSDSQPDLRQVIKLNENLQLAELENYLQCSQLDLLSFSQLQNIPDQPATIHLINLGDAVEVIVESRDRSLHRHSPDSQLVKQNLFNLLNNLQDERFVYTDTSTILPYAQTLYNELIAPIKDHLPPSGTLVFAPDSAFQNLPMGLLHDGQDYLLQQYSIALTLNSQIRKPKALSQNQFRALVAGLAAKHPPSFNSPAVPKGLTPLPETLIEIDRVKEFVVSSVLLDRDFTTARFQAEIARADYPIVHITTHGKFSSDPDRTFILDWDQALNVKQLNFLLHGSSNQAGIELLVLSACQTAVGDSRSVLGIAGVAVQAGARSTIASLWLVDADSTALLMGKFYEGLRRGLSKAEALRQAQLSLLANPKYIHPYYWMPFVLVGSWL